MYSANVPALGLEKTTGCGDKTIAFVLRGNAITPFFCKAETLESYPGKIDWFR
jgi:hypothetical protein